METSIAAVVPGEPVFTEVAALFDDYRGHYGQAPDRERTAHWLAAQLMAGPLRLAAALRDGHPSGLITAVLLPASLRLGTVYSIRDLYVPPAHRRTGTARALMSYAITEARSAGALRISLQTEPDNLPAQTLYADLGFRPVHDLDILDLPLSR
ncbi:GNAT family N-acetyltransferase [Actinoplanes sp. G11-F43]|uniref:GNAT family N-acetyltransferase n=1 Tax=Actinoplanes sp. G11-F43 TaxID=3424130 RepID=UPI003D32A99C